jgi:hypothetical protein
VHLFRPDRELAVVSENADVHALVTYSNGAVESTFACDWDAQFTIVCSKISIALETYKPFAGTYNPGSRQHTFGALIGVGAGSGGGADPVAYSSGAMIIGVSNAGIPDQTATFAIPDLARRYHPLVAALPQWMRRSFRVQLANAFGFVAWDAALDPDLSLHGIPVPGGCSRVVVYSVWDFTGAGPGSSTGYLVTHHFKLGL